MPYSPKTYTSQVTAADLSRAETGIQTAQAGVDLAAPQAALDVVESTAAAAVPKSLVDAKGDLVAATAADVPARLAIGVNGEVLTADSTAATGLKWAPGAAGAAGPVFRVDDYLTGGATDKAAALNAIAAATAATKGGTVEFAARTYTMADAELVLPASAVKAVNLKGQGVLSTRLNFTTDRGAGTFAIHHDGLVSATCYSLISDMNIVGPSTTTTLGASPSTMRGIRQTRRMALERCAISGFHSGVQVAGDHTRSRDLIISNCYYSMYFAEMAGFFGDNLVENCDIAGTLFASIGIANDALASINMIGGHTGFGPYCIYIEAGSSAALSLGGATFLRTSFELAGNGWIFSPDKSANIDGADFIDCGFTRSAVTYKLAAAAADYGFYVGEMKRAKFQGSTLRDAFAVAQFFVSTMETFDMDRAETSWAAVETAGTIFMLASASQVGINLTSNLWKARGKRAGVSVTKGQLVGRGTIWFYPFATGNGIVLEGVALNTALSTGSTICFACYEGENIYTLAQATLTANQSLVVNATDRNKVSSEANTGQALTRQQVGMPFSGDGSTGSVQAVVRI